MILDRIKMYIFLMFESPNFRVGFIEAWGRGIEKIKDSCAQAGNPMPEYMVKKRILW